MTTPKTGAELRKILSSRKLERVVVLGANGTMGYGSAALFTTAVPEVILLARTKAKAEVGLADAFKQAAFEFVLECSYLLTDGRLGNEISFGGKRKALEIDEVAIHF